MLTILNIINYLTNKPVSQTVLVLITCAIYIFLFYYYWNDIKTTAKYSIFNAVIIITITVMLIVDLFSLIKLPEKPPKWL